jgi:acetylornithine/N-succinyldiaminopimelate aminotransferase
MDTNNPFMHTIDRLPIDIVNGSYSSLQDSDGKWYLDFWGDEGVASLGYATPWVQSVFREFAETVGLPHRLPDAYPNELRTRAAAALCKAAKYDQAFFCNSGAEANEAAIKLARRYWSKVRGSEHHRRINILTIEGNFHGRSGYSLAASDSIDSPYHKEGYGPTPRGFGIIHDDLDTSRIRIWDNTYERYVQASTYLQTESPFHDWSKCAAVIMAPILGNNTVRTYPVSFWNQLESLRKRHGFLLIFDEVQVATGRTGYFCAHHNPAITHGVRPDIIAVGKGIAAGLPAAMVLADHEVARAFQPGVHFSTFGASLIVCRMMEEVIRFVEEYQAGIRARGDQFVRGFETLQSKDLITSFDGAGVHWGFTPNWARLGATGPEICDRARSYGLLMLTHRKQAPIRFTPPLTISATDLADGFSALHQTLTSFIG